MDGGAGVEGEGLVEDELVEGSQGGSGGGSGVDGQNGPNSDSSAATGAPAVDESGSAAASTAVAMPTRRGLSKPAAKLGAQREASGGAEGVDAVVEVNYSSNYTTA